MMRSRLSLFLVAAMIGAAILGSPTRAHADFIIRATDLNNGGSVNANITDTGLSAANGSGSLTFNHTVGTFSITLVTNIATTGPGFTSASTTINITYNGPTGVGNVHSLIIEVLGNKFVNPTAPAGSRITSNGSPSTSGLGATSVVMTSGVIAGNVLALGAAGTTLGGQLGMTTGSGSMGSASSVLSPNPVTGASFAIVNPFSFYQTYTYTGFSNSDQAGSLSAGSTVSSVPAPAGFVLALTGLPVLGFGWLRRRQALQTA